MRLKFWKREKKDDVKQMMLDEMVLNEPIIRTYVNAGAIKDCSCDNNLNDPHCITHGIPDLSHLTKEDQCHGKIKSGARCSRVVKNGMYCSQHKRS